MCLSKKQTDCMGLFQQNAVELRVSIRLYSRLSIQDYPQKLICSVPGRLCIHHKTYCHSKPALQHG